MTKNRRKYTVIIIALVIALGVGSYLTVSIYVSRNADAVGPSTQGASSTSLVSSTGDAASISVQQFSTGTGSDKVTYYVADVKLESATDLEAAFAMSEFEAKRVQDTSVIAEANEAVLAINGDYYSSRSDGVIIRNGVLYRSVPVRTGLALYEDGRFEVYEETEISAEDLLADGVWNTYSFGPALLVDGVFEDGLDTAEPDPNTRHTVQGEQPRTGIGVMEKNHFVLVVVDGRSPGYSRGVTLSEFAQIFKELGCIAAYNLDGGGSATMYFDGQVVNVPSQKSGERGVSDILFVR